MTAIEIFLKKFAEQFDETESTVFRPETLFKENEAWDSMTALSVIAMADENYGVILTGDDVRHAKTIQDVFDAITSKMSHS
ncbi:acyl carrier protein [Mucilaginibacter aquaedulcis]|uniref:acyl carrier protein n=1 Tax=Mucilaginibacter aquaedulcis TaxID=1187081 RepID=UPI0025B57D93|nr:acyl carrier protein [Mucilaginibacter aquaedulcis]MDN3548720.1 acyl carrier protein [Mucilaginibacter aquaedulcis]